MRVHIPVCFAPPTDRVRQPCPLRVFSMSRLRSIHDCLWFSTVPYRENFHDYSWLLVFIVPYRENFHQHSWLLVVYSPVPWKFSSTFMTACGLQSRTVKIFINIHDCLGLQSRTVKIFMKIFMAHENFHEVSHDTSYHRCVLLTFNCGTRQRQSGH
jgi:hypothetical protein